MPKSPSPEPLEAEVLHENEYVLHLKPTNIIKEYPTPRKAMVQGTVSFLEAKGIQFFKEDVFRHFEVSHTQANSRKKSRIRADYA